MNKSNLEFIILVIAGSGVVIAFGVATLRLALIIALLVVKASL